MTYNRMYAIFSSGEYPELISPGSDTGGIDWELLAETIEFLEKNNPWDIFTVVLFK